MAARFSLPRVLTVSILAYGCCIAAFATSFSSVNPLNTNADTDVELDGNPSLAGDSEGNMVAVWSSSNLQNNNIGIDGDIFAAYSSDAGATWSDPVEVTPDPATDTAADQTPVVATDGAGNWVAVWISDNTLGGVIGNDFDLLFSRSTDNGMTWSIPTYLNSAAPTSNATDADPVIAAAGNNVFVVAWYSSASLGTVFTNDFDIHYARSTNGGASWKDEQLLNTDGDTDSRFDQYPGITTDGNGNWVVMWLGEGEDFVYEVLVARSTNDGKSWKNQQVIGMGSSQPRIASDGNGNWVAVWTYLNAISKGVVPDNDIAVSRSSDDGKTWTEQELLNSEAETDEHNDQKPTITSDGNGKWLATWTSNNPLDGGAPDDFDIHEARSDDNGQNWTNAKQLHDNASSDLGSDVNSTVVATDADAWLAVWESYETFGGTLGSDADIVFSRAFPSSYTIVTPNGGESWKIGKKKSIEWLTTSGSGKVKLILLRDGNEVTVIKKKTADDGLFKWEVPAGVGTGNDFKVRIEAKSDSANADESDDTFEIRSGK